MIDELSQSSRYQQETSHALLALRGHTGIRPVRATLFGARLAACAGVTPGSHAHAQGPCFDLKWVSMMLLVPVPVTAWYCEGEPTFVDCLALVRRRLWRARYFVNSTDKPGFVQFPPGAFDLLRHGLLLIS